MHDLLFDLFLYLVTPCLTSHSLRVTSSSLCVTPCLTSHSCREASYLTSSPRVISCFL